MRRSVTWIAGIVGIAALVRLLRGRRRSPVTPQSEIGSDDPAVELRSKLAETREQPPHGPDSAAEAEATDDPGTIDERRARIHEKAQQAIDEMSADDT